MTTTSTHRRTIAKVALAPTVLMLLLATFGITSSPAEAAPPATVTVCHATSAIQNPYNQLTVSRSSLDGGGGNDHTLHTGPVFDFSDPEANSGWGDIIPPFDDFAGTNWSEAGQAIHAAGCTVPAPEECPDGAAPVEGQCPTEEPCGFDAELSADDPACVPPVEPCGFDAELSADDPACVPPVEACGFDAELSADDPACVPPVEPCGFDGELSADDPACVPTDPTDPTDPIDPVDPTDPIDPTDPSDGARPVHVSGSTVGPTMRVQGAQTLPVTGRGLAPMGAIGLGFCLLGAGLLLLVRRAGARLD